MVPSHHKKKSSQKKLGEDPFWGTFWGALRGPGCPNCQKKNSNFNLIGVYLYVFWDEKFIGIQ